MTVLKIDKDVPQLKLETSRYFLVYFVDHHCVALYLRSQLEDDVIDPPLEVIYLESLETINFRIPEKLNSLEMNFGVENQAIMFEFEDEAKKNLIGDTLKKQHKKLKDETRKLEEEVAKGESVFFEGQGTGSNFKMDTGQGNDPGAKRGSRKSKRMSFKVKTQADSHGKVKHPVREYKPVEFKYKLAKMMESALTSSFQRQVQREVQLPKVPLLRLPELPESRLQSGHSRTEECVQQDLHWPDEVVRSRLLAKEWTRLTPI